jgi:DNA gyrase inhibitor GyrI
MGSMSFVLPFSFTKIDQLPVPTDKRITLREIPKRILAVVSFSGWYSQAEGNNQLKKLKTWLESDKLIPEGSINDENSVKWSVAQYHPPFTLPFLRRNEIWVELDEKNEEIKKALEGIEDVDENKK